MIRSLPSITTTVSSDREIGLYQAWSPDACTSRALGRKVLHFSNNAMFCRVSVLTGPPGRWTEKFSPKGNGEGLKPQGHERCDIGRGSPRPRNLYAARFEWSPTCVD